MSKRQESIFLNLQQANQRAIEMEQNLFEAQTKFENASKEVELIKKQAEDSIKKQENQSQNQIATDLQRLKESTMTTIFNQQQKIQKQLATRAIDFAITKVEQTFQKGLTENVQKSINTATLVKFV